MRFCHNFKKSMSESEKPKKCYANHNIVIGTCFTFGGDFLFDYYKECGTRNQRPFQYVIIDEVDQLKID